MNNDKMWDCFCPFVEFHSRIFKYVCPVQICCAVNV